MIKENQKVFNALNAVSDALAVVAAMLLAYVIRFFVLEGGVPYYEVLYYLRASLLAAPFFVFIYALAGLYESFRSGRFLTQFGRIIICNIAGTLLLVAAFYVFRSVDVSRLTLVIFFVLCTLGVGGKRYVVRLLLRRYRSKGYNTKNVLLVGSGEAGERYIKAITTDRNYGFTLAGCVTDGVPPKGARLLGGLGALDDVLAAGEFDEVVAALSLEETPYIRQVILSCEKSGTKLSVIPFYSEYIPPHPYIDEIGGIALFNIRRIPLDNAANAFVKRAFDILGSLILIIVTSPLLLFAAIGTRLSSPGPVIFKQERVGRSKKRFTMYKLRTMRVNGREDSAWTSADDPRRTRFGALLRKFSVDELPQLLNVLKGEMSLVGPRPELPFFVDRFRESVPLYMVKHQVRPGMTGWAQINGLRGDTSIPDRIEHDIFYIENWSILLDIKILLMTLYKGIVNKERITAFRPREEVPHEQQTAKK
ncbi:MAG: undecaprenyl-phosphate glucose phosphotransferase [Clostridiales bacterium]|nr:undecaprenyl-phosphate glucose phosphotransferase [Clostridiales bacterium]